MAENITLEDEDGADEIAIMNPNEKSNSKKTSSLKTNEPLKISESHSPDKSQSGDVNVSSKGPKKDIEGSASVSDIPEDKIVTDKSAAMVTSLRKSRSACRARSRDPRKCQMNFREMIGKHETRNEELEQLEGDLRERLDMLECSMPAVMVWNILRMGQGASPSVIRRLMEKQFQGVHAADNVTVPSTPSRHYDYRVREVEAERKEALRRAEEARALLMDKEAAIEERRKRLEKAKECNRERKERAERLNREAAELREAMKNARGNGVSSEAEECGDTRCEGKLLDNIGSLSSIDSKDLECFAKLQDLAESEICMKRQISELERREEVYMRTLQQAEELWSKMEGDSADNVRELQEQLRLKIAANQQLANKVCQLEDELEKLGKRLVSCKEELGKFTSRVYTDSEIGFEDGIATVEDRGIVAAARTSTSYASASPQTVDVDSTAIPETTDKASSIAPVSAEKGVTVVRKVANKVSEAIVEKTERGIGRPIGLGTDAGIGDAHIGEPDDAVSEIDRHEKRKPSASIAEPVDKEDMPDRIESSIWDEGYPPDSIAKDMVETSTGMESEEPFKKTLMSDAKVQATIDTVEQPVGGSEAEDIAEIIREIPISSKSETGKDSTLPPLIKHIDDTETATENIHETLQPESEEKITIDTVEQPVGESEAEDIAEIIRQISISSKRETVKDSTLPPLIEHIDDTETASEKIYETRQPEAEKKTTFDTVEHSIGRSEAEDIAEIIREIPISSESETVKDSTLSPLIKHIDDTKTATEKIRETHRPEPEKKTTVDTAEQPIGGSETANIVDIIRDIPISLKSKIAKDLDLSTLIKHTDDTKTATESIHETHQSESEKKAKVDTGEQPVRGRKTEDIVEIISEIPISSKSEAGEDLASSPLIERADTTKTGPKKVDETHQPKSEKKVDQDPTRIRDSTEKVIGEMESEIVDAIHKTDQSSKIGTATRKEISSGEDDEAELEDSADKITYDTYKRKSKSKIMTRRMMPSDKESDGIGHYDSTSATHRTPTVHDDRTPPAHHTTGTQYGKDIIDEPIAETYRPSTDKRKSTDHMSISRNMSEVNVDQIENDIVESVEIGRPRDNTEALNSQHAKQYEKDEKIDPNKGKVQRTSQEIVRRGSEQKDFDKRTKTHSKDGAPIAERYAHTGNGGSLKYDESYAENGNMRRRSVAGVDDNDALIERKVEDISEDTEHLDSRESSSSKRLNVVCTESQVMTDKLEAAGFQTADEETIRRTKEDKSRERSMSKNQEGLSTEGDTIFEHDKYIVDKPVASEENISAPKVRTHIESSLEPDDIRKRGTHKPKPPEAEDEEEIPEAWKNWDWNQGCPPDAFCSDMTENVTGKRDFAKTESRVQASPEMVEKSVGRQKSEDVAKKDKAVKDVDSPSLSKIDDGTATTEFDQVVLSREELRNWYNIVNSVHHKISRCLSCKSEANAIAQLMGKMKNHIRITALTDDEEDPITREEVVEPLTHTANIENEILANVNDRSGDYDKSETPISISTAKPDEGAIVTIDSDDLDDKNENLGSVLEESAKENIETGIATADATLPPEDKRSTEETSEMLNEVSKMVIPQIIIAEEQSGLGNSVSPAALLQTLPEDEIKDDEALATAKPDTEEKSLDLLTTMEAELNKTLEKEQENTSSTISVSTDALEIKKDLLNISESSEGFVQPRSPTDPQMIETVSTSKTSVYPDVDDKMKGKEDKSPSVPDDTKDRSNKSVEIAQGMPSRPMTDEETATGLKFERERKMAQPETAELCICSPTICRPIIACERVVHAEETQTSPQIPRTLNRINLKPITESIRPSPDVLMWRRPLIWSKRRKDKSTLTTICVETQTDNASVRERVAQRGIGRKDDCTCSGSSPRNTKFGGSDKRGSPHRTEERLAAPASRTVAELFVPARSRASVSSREQDILLTQYVDKPSTPDNSELCCVECGKPIMSEATTVSLNSNARSGTKPQKGLMRTLKKIATSSTSRMVRKKDDFTCCVCKGPDKDRTEDILERAKIKIEKSSHEQKDEAELCCPYLSGIKEKKAGETLKPSKKRRKPEKKDQSVTANLPKNKSKNRADPTIVLKNKVKSPPNEQYCITKGTSKVASSTSKTESKHSERIATETIKKKSRDKSIARADTAVKQLAANVSSTSGSMQCGCDDDESVLVPQTNDATILNTDIAKDEYPWSSSAESVSKMGSCNCADTTKQ